MPLSVCVYVYALDVSLRLAKHLLLANCSPLWFDSQLGTELGRVLFFYS